MSCGHNYLKVFSLNGVPKEQVTVNGELILGYPLTRDKIDWKKRMKSAMSTKISLYILAFSYLLAKSSLVPFGI